jgi:hypothetical protein
LPWVLWPIMWTDQQSIRVGWQVSVITLCKLMRLVR